MISKLHIFIPNCDLSLANWLWFHNDYCSIHGYIIYRYKDSFSLLAKELLVYEGLIPISQNNNFELVAHSTKWQEEQTGLSMRNISWPDGRGSSPWEYNQVSSHRNVLLNLSSNDMNWCTNQSLSFFTSLDEDISMMLNCTYRHFQQDRHQIYEGRAETGKDYPSRLPFKSRKP